MGWLRTILIVVVAVAVYLAVPYAIGYFLFPEDGDFTKGWRGLTFLFVVLWVFFPPALLLLRISGGNVQKAGIIVGLITLAIVLLVLGEDAIHLRF